MLSKTKVGIVIASILAVTSIVVGAYFLGYEIGQTEQLLTESNTQDMRYLGPVGHISFTALWNGTGESKPMENVKVTVLTTQLFFVQEGYTDSEGEANFDLTSEPQTIYYVKAEATVHFNLGGSETHVGYWIVDINPESTDTLTLNIVYSPKIWKELPDTEI